MGSSACRTLNLLLPTVTMASSPPRLGAASSSSTSSPSSSSSSSSSSAFRPRFPRFFVPFFSASGAFPEPSFALPLELLLLRRVKVKSRSNQRYHISFSK